MPNIIVTGANKGIGYALVQTLAADSANRIVALARNLQSLQQLQTIHPNVIPIYANFSQTDFTETISHIAQHITHINALVNNVGILIKKPFVDLTAADWLESFTVNFFSAVQLIQQLLPSFAPSSHIVNISSMSGFQGSTKFADMTAYCTSKAALSNLTECLAVDLSPQKISVNCLALGAVQTEMLQTAFPHYKAPLDAAQMAIFIANFVLTGHQFFNGQILPVTLSNP